MRKGKLAVFAVALMLLVAVTGCDLKKDKESGKSSTKKVVTCTTSVSGVDVEFNMTFEGKKIKGMDFNYDMDLSAYSDAQIKAVGAQDFCSVVKKSFTGFENAFENCDQDIKNKHLVVNSKLDVEKLSSSMKDTMVSPEKAKEGLEATGYTCVIK